MAGMASATLGSTLDSQGDSKTNPIVREGILEPTNGIVDAEAADGVGTNGRDSSYQRYDIQQASKWIEGDVRFLPVDAS
ncbi:RING finger and transmembrane domain-containing protein [Quillaja saponaria]|uniref:RING finger and transmembrane domain-containing protein n=1 Tax=Quillaja saponaria TaxID=32244 RepID=A0AAD7PN94_QUISA|nr:RING finger and transmembrane domain-containing protein [Quillaja saponaria]